MLALSGGTFLGACIAAAIIWRIEGQGTDYGDDRLGETRSECSGARIGMFLLGCWDVGLWGVCDLYMYMYVLHNIVVYKSLKAILILH